MQLTPLLLSVGRGGYTGQRRRRKLVVGESTEKREEKGAFWRWLLLLPLFPSGVRGGGEGAAP